MKKLKPLFRYGSKFMLSSVLITLYADTNSLIIGNKYSAEDLAFYQKGTNFPKLLAMNIITAINTSLFPVMSKIDDPETLKNIVRRFNRLSAFVLTPMMFGFAAVANSFVEVVLTEKWMQCAVFLQICCFSYAIQPLGMSSLQYLRATGKATEYLVLDIIRKAISIILVILAVVFKKGIIGIALADVIANFVAIFVNMFPGKRHVGYKVTEQIFDVLPKFALSAIMFVVVYFVGLINLPTIVIFLLQIVTGVSIYCVLAYLLRMRELGEVMRLLKKMIKKFDRRNKNVTLH